MKNLVSGLTLIIQKKDSRLVLIISTFIFLFLILLSQNGGATKDILSFDSLSFYKRLSLSLSTFFDIKDSFTISALILSFLGSMLGAINLSLAYTYVRVRGEAILHSHRRHHLYNGIGLLLAFLGVGCAACGTALLSVILSFFGFSAVLNFLPYHGQEVGYLGIIVLCIATYSLAQKVMAPNVC